MAKIKIEKGEGWERVDTKKYSEGKFVTPSASTADKGKEYHKSWAEKIYSAFLTNNTWLDGRSIIDENRAYADGKHDMNQVKDWILGKQTKTAEESAFDAAGFDIRDKNTPESDRKAWEVIDFTPVSIAPKIFTKINEDIRSMYYELSCNAIDSYSSAQEETEKYKLWFYKENQKWIQSQQAMLGLTQAEPDFIPENLDELEVYALTGGFKVPYAITMEDLLKHSFNVSDWDKEVAEKLRKDLFSNGYAIVKEEFDREMKRVVVRYCDIKFTGMASSTDRSFKNSSFAYELYMADLSYVRQRLKLDQNSAAQLAFSYSGLYGNPNETEWSKYNTFDIDRNNFGFDFYKVPLFYGEFKDVDNEYYLAFQDKHGNPRTKKYVDTIQDNEELKKDEIRYVRQFTWVPGTDYLFDWGRKEYLPRDRYKAPRLSYRAVKLTVPSIIEQIKPFIKGFNLAWIKAQLAISNAVGNGLAIDIGSIKSISIGKDKSYDPLQILAFYRQSSFLMYKRPQSLSGFNKYAAPPVIPINNDMFQNIEAQFKSMDYYLQKIEDASGISMVATGKAADPNVAKFNMQVSIQGTNSIINSISRAQTDLQEDVAINVCYRIRSLCYMNKSISDSYSNVVGERRMKEFVEAEKNNVEYGITIQTTNNAERKQVILNVLNASIDPSGSPESGKLDFSEAMIIYDMLFQDQNLRRIALVLGGKMRRKTRAAQQFKMAAIQQQNQGLLQIKQEEGMQKQAEWDYQSSALWRKFWADYVLKNNMEPEVGLRKNYPVTPIDEFQKAQEMAAMAQQQQGQQQMQEPELQQ